MKSFTRGKIYLDTNISSDMMEYKLIIEEEKNESNKCI